MEEEPKRLKGEVRYKDRALSGVDWCQDCINFRDFENLGWYKYGLCKKVEGEIKFCANCVLFERR